MIISKVKNTAEHKMQKSVEALKADLAKVRTGRAHTGLLDHVMIDYYGTPTSINQVANITLVDARYHRRATVGKNDGRQGGKGNPRFRPRPQPGCAGVTCCAFPCRCSPRSVVATSSRW